MARKSHCFDAAKVRSAQSTRWPGGTKSGTNVGNLNLKNRFKEIGDSKNTVFAVPAHPQRKAMLTGGQKVGGSNPLSPTIFPTKPFGDHVKRLLLLGNGMER